MEDKRTTKKRPIIPITCGCLLVLIIGLLFLPYTAAFYFMRLSPGSNSAEIQSPDGRYFASTNIRGFLDSNSTTLNLRDTSGHCRKVAEGVFVGEIKWSPDSKRVATARPISDESADVWYSIVDVATGHQVTDSADIRAIWSHNPKPKVNWKWRDSNTVVVFAEYYNAKTDTLTEKPAVVLTVTDTESGLTVAEKSSP